MFSNYLNIAWRNLWKNKLFSAINVVGLAGGLAVCLLCIAHIQSIYRADSFHPNYDRLVRILTDVTYRDGNKEVWAASPLPLADQLRRDYPFVESTARVVRTNGDVTVNSHAFSDVAVYAVDSAFFGLFRFPLAAGQPATQPGTAVITHETAQRFFGKTSPLGKVIRQAGASPAIVTGVLAPFPAPSHLSFDVLLSLASVQPTRAFQDWADYRQGNTYVLLRPGATLRQLADVLPALTQRATRGLRWQREAGYRLRAQPLAEISPARETVVGMARGMPMWLLASEAGIGLIALLMALFNYVNLTLAQSLSRAREVGVRKAAGAMRGQLMGQFMAESVVLALFSAGLALLLFKLIEDLAFVQRWLSGGIRWNAALVVSFVGFSAIAGLLAGVFPGRILSGFRPAEVLRSQSGLRVIRGLSLRKVLIVAQFSIALVAMMTLLTVRQQMNFMTTGDYGFRRDRILNFPLGEVPFARYADELAKLPGVERIAATSGRMGFFEANEGVVKRTRRAADSVSAYSFAVSPDWRTTMGLALVAGRDLPATGRQVLLNETAVRALGLGSAGAAVGQSVWLTDSTEATVAGVVRDVRFMPFTFDVRPLLLTQQPAQFQYASVAVAAGSEEAVLAGATQLWHQFHARDPFDGQWQNDYMQAQMASSAEDIQFLGLLVGLAFLISTLGLLGIVTYTTRTRTKEIGVRKVLGAEVGQLVWLLARSFVGLLAVAGAIGLPLGYLAGRGILSSFAHHNPVSIGTLLACVGTLGLLGGVSIGFQTYRTAQADPVKSLRTE